MGLLHSLSNREPTTETKKRTSKLRAEAQASKESHFIHLGNMSAVDVAKYVTDDIPTNMLDRKKVNELKTYIKQNPTSPLKHQFEVAMSVLCETNEFDDVEMYRNKNIIDGMAM